MSEWVEKGRKGGVVLLMMADAMPRVSPTWETERVLYIHLKVYSAPAEKFKRGIVYPSNSNAQSIWLPGFPLPPPSCNNHCAATLFRNCLSLCCTCNVNLSTVYLSRSFFCLICFSRSCSLPCSTVSSPFPSPSSSPLSITLPSSSSSSPSPTPILRPVSRDEADSRPSCSSYFAMRLCSRRSSLSRRDSIRVNSVASSGVREARREVWARVMASEGRSSKC